MSDLSIKAIRGMFWSLVENFGLQAIQLVISIILARLLLPEQFGLIGMLTLFIALSQSFLDSGFSCSINPEEGCRSPGCLFRLLFQFAPGCSTDSSVVRYRTIDRPILP